MRRLWLVLLTPLLLPAGWTEYRSGPFNLITDAGGREGRAVLAHFEQLRHVLGTLIGKQDPQPLWPVRLVVFKNPKDLARYKEIAPMSLSRDETVAVMQANEPVPPDASRAMVRLLIDSNAAARMPAEFEEGLQILLSTLQVDATRVTLGTPPPAADRTPGWARLHMLATRPEYSGKIRVLLFNLQQGADREAAYRNAFEKSAGAIDEEVQAYVMAGKFEAVPFSGRPIDPERQFHDRDLDDEEAGLRMAELLLANPAKTAEARSACQEIVNADVASKAGHECLGLLDLRDGDQQAARQEFQAATGEGCRSARAWLELAKLTGNPEAALEAAAKWNPRWSEPHRLMAEQAKNPQHKADLLKKAANLAPRNAGLWRQLAELYTSMDAFSESARAWAAAERAAETPQERQAILEARSNIERLKLAHADEERRRAAEEEARELQKLKDELESRVRSAEAKANRGESPVQPEKIERWWDGPKTTKLQGTLQRVDCQARGAARLSVQTADGKTVQLVVRDPKNVVITGGGDTSLGCGAQRPAKRVSLEFLPKNPPEVTIIEFQ